MENSSISFGQNRVKYFAITEVRKYDKDMNLIAKDSTHRVVYQRP